MLRKALPALWLAAATVFGTVDQAQAQHRERPEHTFGFRCSFDSVQQEQFRRNPGMEQDYRNFLRRASEVTPAEQARINALPDVIVPVVFHVVHNGGASNISDAQVIDALRIINRDFNKENPDTATIDPRFVALASRPGFQFRLAQIDPNGNCTTGITHTFSTQTLVGDNNVKNVIRWDTNRYLNIWVTERANGAGGYAFLPCGGGSLNDGIVILNTQFGSIGRSCRTNFCIRSLTHELGHYFGLPHTWGGSNTPGLASNCSIDDGIADTPNTVGSSGGICNLNEATCGPVANTQNYMDYATCASMFTIGQRNVMRASLNLACRSTLVSPANLVATGTNNGFQAPPCPPVAAFRPTTNVVCPGGAVNFVDESYGNLGTVTYAWSFPGGTPSTANTQNVTVTYAAAGTYDVTLTITGPNGTSTLTKQQVVRVLGAGAAFPAPYAEAFEDNNWLNNPANADKNWRNEAASGSNERWTRVTGVNGPSLAGNSALRLRLPNISDGAVTTLYSPLINLTTSNATDNRLVFDYAYARLTAGSDDVVRIAFSSDCGSSWTTNVNIATGLLVSNTGGQPVTGSFAPSATEWRTRTLPVPSALQGASNLLVRLEAVAGGGNNLFLDNFRVESATVTRTRDLTTHRISVLPNPLTRETAVEFSLDKPTTAQVQVLDLLGRTVLRTAQQQLGSGQQRIALGTDGQQLSPGVYLVQLTLGQERFTSRVLVQ